MKKFSLKPLGDSCMKMSCKSWFFIGLLMTFCLAACSDDDDDAVAPIFPEKQKIVCNAGETKEFTFTANTNWSLASSAIWCKFQSNDMEEFVVSGTAGTQTVTILGVISCWQNRIEWTTVVLFKNTASENTLSASLFLSGAGGKCLFKRQPKSSFC